MIRTDRLSSSSIPGRDARTLFRDIYVVLCTLSTLSNPALDENHVFRSVPMVSLVVDEASQIGVVDYMVVTHSVITTADLSTHA